MDSAVRTIGDAGLEYVEIWGEIPHAYPGWTDKKRLRDVLSTYDMTVTMHAPFTDLNPASPFDPVKGAVERTLEDFVRFAEYLNAKIVTIHPGSVHSEALVPQSFATSVSTMRSMVRTGAGNLSINVENQTKSRSKYHFPLASTPESIELIISEVAGINFTLDTGHANVNGQSPLALAKRVGSKLTEVHLSDNSWSADEHLIPGEGTAPLDEFLSTISETDVLLCLELDPHRYTDEQVVQTAKDTKKKFGRA